MEYTVAADPSRILGLTRSYLQSEEWPWVNQTGIYGGIIVKEDYQVRGVINPGGSWVARILWLLVSAETFGSGFLVWLLWHFLMREEFLPKIEGQTFPTATEGETRVTLGVVNPYVGDDKRYEKYNQPLREWFERTFVKEG